MSKFPRRRECTKIVGKLKKFVENRGKFRGTRLQTVAGIIQQTHFNETCVNQYTYNTCVIYVCLLYDVCLRLET